MPANSLGTLNAPGQSDIHDLIGTGQMVVRASLVNQSAATNSSRIRFQFFVYSPSAFNWTGQSVWRISWRVNSGTLQTRDHIVNWGASELWQTFDDFQVDVAHDANGKATLWFQGSYGATGTSLGGPVTLGSKSWELPAITLTPGATTIRWDAVTQALVYATDAQIHVYPPNQNGAPLDKYVFRWAPVASGTTFPSTFSWLEHNGNICNLASKGSFDKGSGRGPLLRGTRYLVQAQVHNKYGWSPNTPVVAFTTKHTAPDKPPKPTVTSTTPTSVTLAGANPAYVGAGVTSTRWELSRSETFDSVAYVNTGASATFTGLTRATDYFARRKIFNAVGESPWSDTLKVATTLAAPSVPRNLQATSDPTSITLTWDEPADNGGSQVAGYLVTVGQISQVVTDLTATFSNLVPNQDYQVSVVAFSDDAGSSPPATMVASTIPGHPQVTFVVTAGFEDASVSWAAVPQGLAVTKSVLVYDAVEYDSPAELTGLTHNTAYSATIESITDLGTLVTPVEFATLNGTPGKPTVTVVSTAGDGRVVLDASAASLAQIVLWDVRVNGVFFASYASSPIEVLGIAAGGSNFEVRALTDYDFGDWSDAVFATARTAPSPPTNLTIVCTKVATVSFAAPLFSGGAGVSGYHVELALDSGFTNIVNTAQPSFPGEVVFTGIAPNTVYFARVRAINAVGMSGWEGPVNDTSDLFYSALAEVQILGYEPGKPNSAIYAEARATQFITSTCESSQGVNVGTTFASLAILSGATVTVGTSVTGEARVYPISIGRVRDGLDAVSTLVIDGTGTLGVTSEEPTVITGYDLTVPQLSAVATLEILSEGHVYEAENMADTFDVKIVPEPVTWRAWC